MAASFAIKEIQELRDGLRAAVGADAVGAGFSKDLCSRHRRGMDLTRDGLRFADRALEQLLENGSAATCCGAPAGGLLFDGLRLARRGVAQPLAEAEDATSLTAAQLRAFGELRDQIDVLLAAARRHFGAAASLHASVEALQLSQLEGISGLAAALGAAAVAAEGLASEEWEAAAALAVAKRVRQLEAEIKPLLRAVDPTATLRWDKTINDEVIWETRMVDVGGVVAQALADARSEVGGWAICADVGLEFGRMGNESRAAAFQQASRFLQEEGLPSGHRALQAIRVTVNGVKGTVSGAEDDAKGETEDVVLSHDAACWLRQFVGASAILREAAETRLQSKNGNDGMRTALLDAACRLSLASEFGAEPSSESDRIRAAGAAFRKAVTLVPCQDSANLLRQLDKEISEVLGPGWAVDRTPVETPVEIRIAPDSDVVSDTIPNAERTEMTPDKSNGGKCCTIL